jgi:hypothetical protein
MEDMPRWFAGTMPDADVAFSAPSRPFVSCASILGDVLSSLRNIVRVTAVLLLAWTAFDLGYPQCCMREALPTAAATSLAAYDQSAPPAQPDVDDCFCCARCLDTGWRIPVMQPTSIWLEQSEHVSHLTTRAATLDHPPQNA